MKWTIFNQKSSELEADAEIAQILSIKCGIIWRCK